MLGKKSNESILLLLQRSQATLYRPAGNKMATFPFPPELVSDLEIKDEIKLLKSFEAFLTQEKLPESDVVVLLDSSVYFTQKVEDEEDKSKTSQAQSEQADHEQAEKSEKEETNDIAQLEQDKPLHTRNAEIEEQQRRFVQSMPFANVYSTILTFGKEKIIIALNREFYEPLVKAFDNKKFHVTYILPILAATDIFQQGFNEESATLFLNSIEKYRSLNFIQLSVKKDEVQTVTALPKDESAKKRLIIFSVIFLILIVVLGVMLYATRNRAPEKKQLAAPPPAAPVATPEVTPSPTPLVSDTSASVSAQLSNLLSSSASAELANLPIEVIDAGNDQTGAELLVTQLESLGFKSVQQGSVSALTTGNMTVAVTDAVSVELQELLEKQLLEWGYSPSFTTQINQSVAISIKRTSQ